MGPRPHLCVVGILAMAVTFPATLWIQYMRFADDDVYFLLDKEIFTIGAPAMGISLAVGMIGVGLLVAVVVDGSCPGRTDATFSRPRWRCRPISAFS